MHVMTRVFAAAAILLMAVSHTPTAEKVKNDQPTTANSAAAPSVPEPDPDFWTQQD